MINVQFHIVTVDCPRCGIYFGITENFQMRKQKNHKLFWCPSGHPMSYPRKRKEYPKPDKRLAKAIATIEMLKAQIGVYSTRATGAPSKS